MNLVVFLFLLSVLVVQSGSAISEAISKSNLIQTNDRIVGGFETSIQENPWQISLRYFLSHRCGGSIIGESWILTAAHCTDGITAGPLSVRVGSTNLNSGGTIISVKRIHQHEEYNARTLNNDFSLLELAESLTYTDQIQPIALAAANTIIKDGTMAMVSGWGATHTNESNEVLRAAFVPIVNRSQCRRAYGGGITFRMICAGYEAGKKDSCQGDSGGPLTYQNVRKGERELIGVVSFGNGCAKAQYPGVYSRVPSMDQK